jgi:hypothetical protein
MPIPEGFKTVEQIAVELNQTLNRVHTAIRELGIVQQVFPDDRRRRYYSPQDIQRIKKWIEEHA